MLELAYKKKETDEFFNTHYGKQDPNVYYQIGRYYQKIEKNYQHAIKQFDIAFQHDNRHFPSLVRKAEALIELRNYDAAIELLYQARDISNQKTQDLLGLYPRDEVILKEPTSLIDYNLGYAIYKRNMQYLKNREYWQRIQELQKYKSTVDEGIASLFSALDRSQLYFDKALAKGIHNKKLISDIKYYSGWNAYIRSNYYQALENWGSIDPSLSNQYPQLMLAKANSEYMFSIQKKKNNEENIQTHLNSALGNLFYLLEKIESQAKDIIEPDSSNLNHVSVFKNLSMIENNIGAIYELLENKEQSLTHYQKSIEYSTKIEQENEIALVNIRLNFQRDSLSEEEKFPVIMDFIEPLL